MAMNLQFAKIESLNLGWLKFKNGMSLFDQNYTLDKHFIYN